MKRFAALTACALIIAAGATQLLRAVENQSADRPIQPSHAAADCLITVPGDVNASGAVTAGDIIYLCNHTFKGGPDPLPCRANGDVNCSGTVTSADVIRLVGYNFVSGLSPCDICNNSPLAASCQ